MSTFRRALLALLLVALSAFAVAACGSDDSGDSTSTTADTAETEGGGGKTGGTLSAYYTSSPDYMDPALSYTQEGWTALWNVYTPLITYRHAEGEEGSELIPGLAEAMPEVSKDGLTYTLKLRDGLKFSDGTPVKASDFEHTIKRVLNLESGGAPFYQVIEGATEYIEAGKPEGDISGIETNDKTGEITIKLNEKDGSFNNLLAMDFAGLVPGDTPFRNLTTDPPPGVGPYMISESTPNRGFTLERNPEFAALDIPDIPKGNLDTIEVEIVKNQQKQVQDVLQNEVDYLQDPPPGDQMQTVEEQAEGRFEPYPTNSTYYLFLNHRVPPFDNEQVRQAVGYALDETGLARVFGGQLSPGCNFLPPGMPGYEEINPCPYGDPMQPVSEENLQKARDLLEEGGYDGEPVTVWGNDEEPSGPVAQIVSEQLKKIGMDAKPKIVEGSVYFQTIGNQETKAQIGFDNWFQDYPHPSNFVFLVDGSTIQATNNSNHGNVDDPEINDLIAEANQAPDVESVTGDYAEVDRLVVERAHAIPYGHRQLTKLVSDRVDFESYVAHPVYNGDFSLLSLK